MPDKNVSPEKRLLKMIEGQQPATARSTPGQLGNKFFSLSSVRGRLAFMLDRLKRKRSTARRADSAVDLQRVNALLQAAIAVAAVWLVISSTLEYRRVQSMTAVEIKPQPQNAQAQSVEAVSLIQPVGVYLDRVSARDIFSLADTAGEKKESALQEKTENARLKEMTGKLKLVGISWSDSPDAIIEDQTAKRTYFVKEGAMIDDIKVYKILKDRVVLKYQSEEVELR